MLAIVIPAFKVKFLSRTLASLCVQTNKNFNVYVGDDNSTDDIENCVNLFKDKLNLKYKKFEENLGGKSLTSHWQRCIDMVVDEEWLWLLPDDDTASLECVDSFYKELEKDTAKKKLFRFQTNHINEDDVLLNHTNPCPPLESNVDFLIKKLQFERNSSLAEYIFSKEAFISYGGFVDLPLAWGSDDLLWIKLSQENDIVTLPMGKVSLRQSDLNISNNNTSYTNIKFEAKYEYLLFLMRDKDFMKKLLEKYEITDFIKVITNHLFFEYRSHQLQFSFSMILQYASLNNKIIGGGFLKNIYRIIKFKISNAQS